MHITVEDQTVGDNIRSFLVLLRRIEAKRERTGSALFEKSYRAFLNRSTGKLLFADSFKEQVNFSSSDWKELEFSYIFDPISESFHANIYEPHNLKKAFDLNHLSPHAVTAIKSTIHILNNLSSLVKGPNSDSITKIKALCNLQVDVGSAEKDKSILVAAWHGVDRIGAEKILRNKPVGTFLFREDYFASLLQNQLTSELRKDVRCVTMTLVEPEQKISDFTFVHMDHLWRWYNDALFCNVQGFSKIEDLIEALFKGRANNPLYHASRQEWIA